MINQKPNNNQGGVKQLYLLDARYFHRLSSAGSGLFNLEMHTGGELKRIYFTPDTCEVTESRKEDKKGTYFDQQVTCVIPMARAQLLDEFPQRFCIVYLDGNNSWRVVAWKSFFKRSYNMTSGKAFEDRNQVQLTLSRKCLKAQRFIVNPYGEGGEAASGSDGDLLR